MPLPTLPYDILMLRFPVMFLLCFRIFNFVSAPVDRYSWRQLLPSTFFAFSVYVGAAYGQPEKARKHAG